MKQVQDAFSSYPWMITLLAGALFLGIGVTAVVLLVLKRREQKRMQPFEILNEPEPEKEENQPVSAAWAYTASDDDDRTRRLFDYPDVELKSYQLRLYDLGVPGQVYQVLLNDRVVIGRKSHCTVCIPNSTLSGEHCEIVLKNGKMYLHDLNSTNGTFLNGSTNRVTEEELSSGSVIEMGSVRLKAELAVIQM